MTLELGAVVMHSSETLSLEGEGYLEVIHTTYCYQQECTMGTHVS